MKPKYYTYKMLVDLSRLTEAGVKYRMYKSKNPKQWGIQVKYGRKIVLAKDFDKYWK